MRNYCLLMILLALCSRAHATDNAYSSVNGIDSGKITLYVFTGSDWCANCKRLEKNILTDSVFLSSIDSLKIAIVFIDFPQRKKQSQETIQNNTLLAERFDFNGTFPTLVLSSPTTSNFLSFYYKDENTLTFIRLIIAKSKLLHD
ncbi:MAG: thioredoxin family protein [Bacteroidota bacterium]